jgi:GNAT superfamily N-acetyltransferase
VNELAIRKAGPGDTGELTRLINAAFTVERQHFKDRDRTNEDEVKQWLACGTFFVMDGATSGDMAVNVTDTATNTVAINPALTACVYVEPRGESCYFGLLSVDPAKQSQGLGRRLTEFAEDWAKGQGSIAMDLRYVDLREELGRTYARMGYVETGREDVPTGRGFTRAAQFVNMRKPL